jgi:hypothetical protein
MFLLYLTFLNCLGYVVLDADVIELVKWKDAERSGCGLHQHFLWIVVVTLFFIWTECGKWRELPFLRSVLLSSACS